MTPLSESERSVAQVAINKLPAGDYELNQIFGEDWVKISSPTSFGKRFKAAVQLGALNHIKVLDRKSNNHHLYRVG